MRFSLLSRKTWYMRFAGRTYLKGTHDWQRASCEILAEAPEVRIECHVTRNQGEAFFDDFTLERID